MSKKRFPGAFWLLNSIEMGERLAYYNLRVVAPIYIMQADNPGGLHLTAADKGVIYMWWFIIQSLLPILTGGIADRLGYKKTLAFAITTMMLGYVMMAFLRDTALIGNYPAFFLSIMVLAFGTAFFKPGIQGSLANTLTKENSSMGWGLFYWVVNVGAFAGHFIPTVLLVAGGNSTDAWRNVFLASALFTGLNLVLLAVLKDVPSGASKTEPLGRVILRTLANIFDPRLLSFLAIMSGFWLMMYQLWDLQPNFIADWVDSSHLARNAQTILPEWASSRLIEHTARGPMIPQQVLLAVNSLCIILGVVLTSYLTRKMRTLSAMLIGMGSATAGILIAGWTMEATILVLGIVCFSIGEMTTGPKKNEYLSLIAPPGKKGLYLGYVNIPAGVGGLLGSKIAGYVYGHFGEKATLALRYIAENTPLGAGKNWDGSMTSLEKTLGLTRPEAMTALQELTGLDSTGATKLLWETYNPQYAVWLPFAAIGVASGVALYIFARMARRWSDMDA
ncbi:MAG: MFS transporter [Opitutaceae bacterium]|jgi:MFS family permease|nr:MFS transporter [Opitutaceae bacterium]